MESRPSALDMRSPEQVAVGRAWIRTWREAAPRLELIRRRELRQLDAFTAISHLCGVADYHAAPLRPRLHIRVIEQQRLFASLRRP